MSNCETCEILATERRAHCATLRQMVEERARHSATLEELRAVRAELDAAQGFGAQLRRAADNEKLARCRACTTKACDGCSWASPSDVAAARWGVVDG